MPSYQPSTEPAHETTEHRAWQVREIEAALREADAGDFADDAEVATLAGRWFAST